MNLFYKKIKAFTLAEVMVVLGILGVLAAFLMPSIMKTTPDNNKVMFKKAYSTLEQTINQIINDEVNYPPDQTGRLWDQATSGYNGAVVSRGFNYDDGIGGQKFCTQLSDRLNIVGTVTCNSTNGWGSFTTTDGISWKTYEGWGHATQAPGTDDFPLSLDNYAYSSKVMIDVNGNKGPNCTLDSYGNSSTRYSFNYQATCTKPDRFIIGVRFDGKLQIGCSTLPTCTTPTDQKAIDILLTPSKNN